MWKRRPDLGRVGVVASGGSLRGFAIPVYCEAMFARGVDVEKFSGTSVGGMVCAAISQGKNREEKRSLAKNSMGVFAQIDERGSQAVFDLGFMQQIGDAISRGDPMSLVRLYGLRHEIHRLLESDGLLNGGVLYELMKGYDPQRSITSSTELRIVTYNDDQGETVVFSSHDPRFKKDPESLRKVAIATASLDPFFPAVEIFGEMYSDGYCIDVEGLLGECDTIFVLHTHPENYTPIHSKDSDTLKLHKMPPWLSRFSAKHAALIKRMDTKILRDAQALISLRYPGKQIVPVYTELPPTMNALYSKKGDIKKGTPMARRAINEALDRLGL